MIAAPGGKKSKTIPSARALACDILTEAENGPLYVDQVLDRRLADSRLPPKDRALVTAITNGTMRLRGRLDAEIEFYFRRNYDRARPLLKNILRTALFQMRYMNRIPAYAAIHEAVDLARGRFDGRVARLCNAVLRNAQRQPYRWPSAANLLESGDIRRLAQCLSYPEWLVRRWLELHGNHETLAIAAAFNRVPDMTARVVRPQANTELLLKEIVAAGIEFQEIEGLPHFYKLSHTLAPSVLDAFAQGRVTIQDASAGLVAHLAAPAGGDTIIDLCAAPGGKALHLAEIAAPAKVIAVDISPSRLRLVREAAGRLRFPVQTIVADARQFCAAPADIVLVDAPCSGLGVLSRRSDLRWRRQQQDIPELIARQREILGNAATLVRPGGRLVYSTCTTEPEENDGVVNWFLQGHPDFQLLPANRFVSSRFCDRHGFVRTFPHLHDMDGSFAAHLKRAVR